MIKNKIFHKAVNFLMVSVLSALALGGPVTVQAYPDPGTIAYVRPNQADGDEIHLIEPDKSGDRKIFSTGKPLSQYLKAIERIDWKPDASELAFTSSHEEACSVYQTDIFTIRPDGSNYRRITNPPACASRAGLPTGTVKVPVTNNLSVNGPFTFYFQGAPGPIEMALAPGASMTLTFNNVLDFGNQDQYAVWMYGDERAPYSGAQVDVKAGTTVQAGILQMYTGFTHFGYAWAEYLPDGSKILSIQQESWLLQVSSTNQVPGELGDQVSFDMTLGADHLAWGPTAQRSNQFLFRGWTYDSSYISRNPIMLGDISNTKAQMLVDVDPTQIGRWLLGLTWLPDGSGFLYSLTELVGYDFRANIWEYSFATQQSKRVTNVPYGFVREITVSPDGQRLLFELQPYGHWLDQNPAIDLWMANRDGSGMTEFLSGARSPAWSPVAVPGPVVLDHFIYLPAVIKP